MAVGDIILRCDVFVLDLEFDSRDPPCDILVCYIIINEVLIHSSKMPIQAPATSTDLVVISILILSIFSKWSLINSPALGNYVSSANTFRLPDPNRDLYLPMFRTTPCR
jgi:hypothetical protein